MYFCANLENSKELVKKSTSQKTCDVRAGSYPSCVGRVPSGRPNAHEHSAVSLLDNRIAKTSTFPYLECLERLPVGHVLAQKFPEEPLMSSQCIVFLRRDESARDPRTEGVAGRGGEGTVRRNK